VATAEHPKGALPHGNIADELARGQKALEVVVVSPARSIFEGDAHWVTLPAWDRVGGSRGRRLYGPPDPGQLVVGQLGIWPGHAPIVAALGSGLLRIGLGGGRIARFAVRGGFLKVGDNKVTILVDSAVAEADANQAEAQRELDETLAELQHPKSDEKFAELLDRRAWSETRIKLAKK
jgi:F-type H+-transporting ATPase subunit epsilon